jgi:hypothetical protein
MPHLRLLSGLFDVEVSCYKRVRVQVLLSPANLVMLHCASSVDEDSVAGYLRVPANGPFGLCS